MPKEKRCQAKNWCFTLNNYTPEEENRLKELDCEYMIFGHEHLEDGTPHLQGAMCFKGKRDQKALKKLFPRMHLEVMKGSVQASKDYCTKEDETGYFEKGIIPVSGGQKNKKRWEEAYQAALEGRFDDIPRDMYLCHDRAFHRVYEENQKDPSMEEMGDDDLKDHFLWLWGPTGTGKSHLARQISKNLGCEEPYLKGLNKWWNGYKCQWVTIIDEADPKRCEHLAGFFKQWCDKWPTQGEVKCGNFPCMRPHYIIVTSNYSIADCFPNENDWMPLKRRFTEHELRNKGEPFAWPRAPEIKESGAAAPPGNTIPGEQELPAVEGSIPEETQTLEEIEEAEEPLLKRARVLEE